MSDHEQPGEGIEDAAAPKVRAKRKKPIIFSTAETDQEQSMGEIMQRFDVPDASYVPGYGEIVKANDVARARMPEARKRKLYQQIGTQPRELNVELRWLRQTGPAGERSATADASRMEAVHTVGFRLATEEDLVRNGFSLPPAGYVAPDGTIRQLDTALYICDGKVARAWEEHKQQEAADLEGQHPDRFRDGSYDAETFEFANERGTLLFTSDSE